MSTIGCGSTTLIAAAVSLAASEMALAQIATDNTFGSARALAGPNYAITADLGRQLGANLFHSFSTFNLVNGQSATFSGPAGIANIINRVTGGTASAIDGVLRSTIAGAHLFLINPKGILFGPNASLDLTGSFRAATADYIRLGAGGRFDASNPAASVLTAAPPEAFGFLGPTPAPIRIENAQIATPNGSSLQLAGGPLTVSNSFVRTLGGNLALTAVGSAGEIGMDAAATPSAGMRFADVSIIQNSEIRSSSFVGTTMPPPGRLVIRGGRITIADSVVRSLNGTSGDAAPLQVVASGDVTLANSLLLASTTRAARGADLTVSGENVLLHRATRVQNNTSSDGNAGDLVLRANGALRLVAAAGDPGFTAVTGSATGRGTTGTIGLHGDTVTIDAAVLSNATSSPAKAGPTVINARGDVALINGAFLISLVRPAGTGQGGDFQITAGGKVTLQGLDFNGFPTQIQVVTDGRGNGGGVKIRAREIEVAGSVILTQTSLSGNSGPIELDAARILIRDVDGLVGNVSTNSSSLAPGINLAGTGNTGNITVRASESLHITGFGLALNPGLSQMGPSSINSFAAGSGTAGEIVIDARSIVLDRGGAIQTDSGPGGAGNILIRAHDIDIGSRSFILSGSLPGTSGRNGNITIEGTGRLSINAAVNPGGPIEFIEDFAGGIRTGTFGVGAAAGNISITIPEIYGGLGTRIQARTFGTGNSGSISITADRIVLTDASVSATAAGPDVIASRAGNVVISATESIEMSQRTTDSLGARGGIGARTEGAGAAGNIFLTAPSILLDGVVVQSTTASSGIGGSIQIEGNQVSLRNGTQVASSAVAGSTGDAGSITVNAADRLAISGSGSFDGAVSTISAETHGQGRGGLVAVRAGQIAMDQGAISTSTSTGANAGNVDVRAQQLLLTNGARISASSTGAGTAGSISVVASDALDLFGGTISTQARSSDGGDITVQVGNRVHLRNAEISTSVGSGEGSGGNIFIDPIFVILEGSRITANAFGGAGGNIRIISDVFLASPDSVIDASSQLGISGLVQIAALRTDPNAALAPLPSALFDASALLRDSCAGRAGPRASSLVGVGRGGLADAQSGYSASRYFADTPPPSAHTGERVITPAYAAPASPSARIAAPCGLNG